MPALAPTAKHAVGIDRYGRLCHHASYHFSQRRHPARAVCSKESKDAPAGPACPRLSAPLALSSRWTHEPIKSNLDTGNPVLMAPLYVRGRPPLGRHSAELSRSGLLWPGWSGLFRWPASAPRAALFLLKVTTRPVGINHLASPIPHPFAGNTVCSPSCIHTSYCSQCSVSSSSPTTYGVVHPNIRAGKLPLVS